MKKILFVGFFLLSSNLFANDCSVSENEKVKSYQGKVVNVGSEYNMEVVMSLKGKTYYLQFKNSEIKDFFHKNNYRIFEVSGSFGDPKRWPPSFIVEDYKLVD